MKGESNATANFRVAIAHPPSWKIRTIAKYKQTQKAKIVSNELSAPAKVDQLEIPQHQKSAAIEQIKRDLDILQYNGNAIRNKMQALTSVRYSLLWLLKKSTLCQRSIIATEK
jgi:hypothetical protein